MPTYDYRCDLCSEQFEYWQSFNDDTLVTCPATGGPAACTTPGEGPVKKVFSKVGIAFKGDGFYKNDHGANAGGRSRESESTPAATSESGKDSKSESSDKGTGSGSKSSDSSSGSGSKSTDSSTGSGSKSTDSKSSDSSTGKSDSKSNTVSSRSTD